MISTFPEIFVLLPVHNRIHITLEFVKCLTTQTAKSIRLILIDDGSTDGTAAAVTSIYPDTTVLKGDGNLWWAGSLQLAVDYLKVLGVTDVAILMINDDTIIPNGFIQSGLEHLKKCPREIFCAQSYSSESKKLIDAGVKIDWFRYEFKSAQIETEINCLSTRGLFLKFADLLEIGEFKPKILPHYYSDYEFTIRALRRGYGLRCPADLKLEMNEATTGTHSATKLTLRQYLKKVFQIRAAINPWTAFKFITLAAPLRYKLVCYFRLGVYFFKSMIQALGNGV
jgi:GT2 family glycosyltransferase